MVHLSVKTFREMLHYSKHAGKNDKKLVLFQMIYVKLIGGLYFICRDKRLFWLTLVTSASYLILINTLDSKL